MIERGKVVQLLADMMDRMSQQGDYAPHIQEAAQRAVKRAGLPESVYDAALLEASLIKRT